MSTKIINPFKPSAGRMPPILVGRDNIIEDFRDGLDEEAGSPFRLMRITGPRGVGKTVMLIEFRRIAEQQGWVTISENAYAGLTDRLLYRITDIDRRQAGDIDLTIEPSAKAFGVEAKLGSLSIHHKQQSPQLRDALENLTRRLNKKGKGLLITLDEAQAIETPDLRDIANAVQNLNENDLDFAFVFAGLPSIASVWINDKATTFIRRATPEQLGEVPLIEVSNALADSFANTHMTLTGEALRTATESTAGYPFLIQLVGFYIWRAAYRNHNRTLPVTVTQRDAEEGVKAALTRLGDTIHGPELDGLSPIDKTYLLAMAQDDGPSSTSDIADRMGKTKEYANVYRTRLLDAQTIKTVGYGQVDFAIPYLREYLREHGAFMRMTLDLTPEERNERTVWPAQNAGIRS